MPRLSSASAISDAECEAVPRSITLDKSHIVPGAFGGSQTEPARVTT
jgi:hypothetical protein